MGSNPTGNGPGARRHVLPEHDGGERDRHRHLDRDEQRRRRRADEPHTFSDTFAFIARSDAPLSPAARAFVEIAERRLERVSEAALYAAGTSETVE